MVILIVYLTLFHLFRYLHLFIYVNILLFHWVYFTSFFDHYIKQNLLLKSSHWEIFYKIDVLNQS